LWIVIQRPKSLLNVAYPSLNRNHIITPVTAAKLAIPTPIPSPNLVSIPVLVLGSTGSVVEVAEVEELERLEAGKVDELEKAD
jgi:hypothetical protein